MTLVSTSEYGGLGNNNVYGVMYFAHDTPRLYFDCPLIYTSMNHRKKLNLLLKLIAKHIQSNEMYLTIINFVLLSIYIVFLYTFSRKTVDSRFFNAN